MKKIIGILAALLVITTVSGQPSGLCDFLLNLSEDQTMTHRVQINGKTFAIGYDSDIERKYLQTTSDNPNDILERTISLYRMDRTGWVRVSDVIKTDYLKIENGVQSYSYYKDNCSYMKQIGADLNSLEKLKDVGYSSLTASHDGNLVLHMLSFHGIVGVDDDYNYSWQSYTLVLQDNGKYKTHKNYMPKIRMKLIQ